MQPPPVLTFVLGKCKGRWFVLICLVGSFFKSNSGMAKDADLIGFRYNTVRRTIV
jgi:hypothetical protein